MARLFISQEQMDRWTTEGKVALHDQTMTLPALGRSFQLAPAVYVSKSVDGNDAAGLIGRVKSQEQLAELRAELLGSSLIVGESGYECVEGFLGVPIDTVGIQGSGLLRLGK